MELNFTAIDFETANRKRHSACSIGMAKVRNGEVVKTFYELLYPDGEEFEFINISIHGITAEQVCGCKSLVTMWEEIAEFIEDDVLVAHNASFEQSVINQTLSKHGLPIPSNHYLCTCYTTKVCYPKRNSYSLSEVYRDILGKEVDHHNALEDAVACAHLALHLLQQFPSQPLPHLISALYETPVREKTMWKNLKGIKSTKDEFNQQDFWYGKTVAITGELVMRREDMVRWLLDRGAKYSESVTMKTNVLIVGNEERHILQHGRVSTKMFNAGRFNEKGAMIQIMKEKEFSNILTAGV